MHQPMSYNPDPMYSCIEFGCFPFRVYGNNFHTNYCCFRCDNCITMSNNVIDEIDWALKNLGINLYG
jgi:hypothetical protein